MARLTIVGGRDAINRVCRMLVVGHQAFIATPPLPHSPTPPLTQSCERCRQA
ncbi:MAG: hypothetical protein KME22_10870 [Hassallia sp. WJT32-NPBG1]|nr:hypothetical protein [Hassallia sp. WJT32-NPBG1]